MKYLTTIIALVLLAFAAQAEVRQQTLSATTITTNQGTSAQVVKGVVKNIYFDIPATKTGGVTIVSSDGVTLLSVSGVVADTLYPVRVPATTTAGATISWITAQAAAANAATNIVYEPVAIAGTVTATFIPAANTSETNTYRALITFDE
jgi:cytoskeletal protein RodZ